MDEIAFSVIVPFFNTEEYIGECLLSITKQSLKDIEIVCIDDGSTDDSLSIVEAMQREDGRIKIFRQKNMGLSVARNIGVAEATGKYVCFVDSDDMLAGGALERLQLALSGNDYQFVCYDMQLLYETDVLRPENDYFIRRYKYNEAKTGRELFMQMMQNDDFCVCACLLCLKREWLINEKMFFVPGILYEDNAFSVECYLKAKSVSYIAEELYIYRKHNNSIMSSKETCRNLRSLVFLFGHVWRFVAKYENDRLLYKQLLRYMNIITEQMRTVNKKISYKERSLYQSESLTEDVLLRYSALGEYESQEFDENFYWESVLAKLNSAEEIILYGAGKKGKFVYEYLRKKDLSHKVTAFAVTYADKPSQRYMGCPVFGIGRIAEIIAGKNAFIILTVRKEKQKELRKECYLHGIKQLVGLDRIIEQRMRNEMENL